MSEIALRLQDVHVTYGNSQQSVLSGFSMSVHKGEIACLLGASGCGKTTV
ncbi:ABC transporter ATP-binding protein, partial [Klebsiella pneumoniae]|nr:ABC transporter ATP-binding protein [Klebsiella pneumoniae]